MITTPEDSPLCYLYGTVMMAPAEELFSDWLEQALSLNIYGRALGGCWLAYDSENRLLLLCHNLPVAKTSGEEFGNTLQNFVQAMKAAREALELDEAALEDLEDEIAIMA